jgi:NTP pyrophosphatase (non-canonical NTP hydrolase)
MTDLEKRIAAWNRRTFPDSPGPWAKVKKLREECEEVAEAAEAYRLNPCAATRKALANECADVAIVLAGIQAACGLSLTRSTQLKFAVVEKRSYPR